MHGVQAHRHHCGCDADHSPAAIHLCGAVAKNIAGFRRIQKADRLSGMGDLVRYRLCFRLFGRRPDPLNVEMTLHQFHHRKKAANWHRQQRISTQALTGLTRAFKCAVDVNDLKSECPESIPGSS
jgi:hypothetical protein